MLKYTLLTSYAPPPPPAEPVVVLRDGKEPQPTEPSKNEPNQNSGFTKNRTPTLK